MSNDYVIRERVKEVYFGSNTWGDKVDRMSMNQVIAVYRRFTAEGKIK